MAKIKVHELAKELGKQSKEILSFLQDKGIEAKAAQSSVEEDAAAMVRRTFGGKSAAGNKQEERPAAAPKVEAPTQQAAPRQEAPAKTAPTENAKAPETKQDTAAPKKKKTIIFVSNPQNSKISGQRQGGQNQGGQSRPNNNNNNSGNRGNNNSGNANNSGQQNRRNNNYNGNNNQGNRGQGQGGYNNRVQVQQAVRPIRPLTPPSPTPSVDMVPATRPAPKRPAQEQALVENKVQQAPVQQPQAQPAQPQQPQAQQAPTPVQPTQPQAQTTQPQAQQVPTQQAPQSQQPQQSRPAQQSQGQNRPSQGGQYQQNRSSQGGQYQQNRSSQGGQYQQNRPSQGGQYQQNRPSQGGQYQQNRPSQGGQYQQNRPSQGGQYQQNRPSQGGQYQQGQSRPQGGQYNNRPAGQQGNASDRPARPAQGGQGGQGGYRSNYNQNSQGGQTGYRGGMNNDRPQGDRNNSARPGRPGQGGPQGDRRSGGAAAGGNRSYNNNFRDNRGPQGQGGQTRDGKSGKALVAEVAGKDVEKRREDEKRRFSAEKDKRSRKDKIYEEEEALKNKPGRFIKPEKKEEQIEEVIKVITLPERITIKELAEKMKLQPAAIVKKLFLAGQIVTVNQEVSYEEAETIAMDYDILCEREVKVDVIEELLKEEDESEEELVERSPVICVMGHVDHGKTSLLDAIRETNVTDKEAGGITQHIGAYTVTVGERKITFLDTPGHEAFTAMRMRGANSTDIAILVVAADDGVMPQTIEAINHAKAAGIEIIVAVNKIDKPSANIDRVKQELAGYELVPEDWGGSTVFAPVSAKTGEGIEQMLEMILLTADILELKANPNRRARGLVIEAELDKGRGPVATVLVQKGTLHVGDFVSAGASHGKVRAMIDDKGKRVKEAGPSTPVEILGLSDVPSAGEVFLAHENDKTARSYAETYLAQNKEKMLEETKGRMSLDDLFSQIQEGNLKELNLIVKADVQGSVEAVKQSLTKLSNEEVVVKCIHGGVGAINESDVTLASASNAIIIGFNVRPDATAKATAEREGVDMRLYKVIYQAIEDIEAAMKGMLDPVFEEKVIGHAEVRQIFRASAIGNIAGSYVLDGTFQRNCKVRITREGEQIFEGDLSSLKRFKDDVKEVKAGFECGLVFDGFDQIQEFDIVEAYIMVEVPR